MAAKKNWQDMLEDTFDKLPSLPKGAKDVLVKVTPWVALVFGVLGILASLAALGIVTALSPFIAMGGGFGTASGSLVSLVLGLASSVLLLAAFPGTKARKMQGWNMLFWSEAVGVVSSLASFALGGVVWALVAFYLLYQIKSYYK